jgi:maltose/moltooligosaccharide transporter
MPRVPVLSLSPVALVPMILLGIAWASMMGIPYIMVASMVPKERLGVYMGIVNMMIVVPMLIQTVTFGWIFTNLLGSDGTNAIIFSGVLFAIGVAMLWVNPPKENEESPIMPLGGPTDITVYDRVVVGSDGTPTSLKTVFHAAAVAAAARLVIVSAYTLDSEAKTTATGKRVPGVRRLLYGEEAARAALRTSIKELSTERVRNTETRIVEGDPAKTLLEVAGLNPANVIVVGNRGLGAADGQLLGSVPGDVAKNATCDVLIVQTSDWTATR